MLKKALEVGNKIKELRMNSNLTQEQLADKIGISGQAISKWEKGESYPDIQQLVQISELFDVTLDDLIIEKKLILEENKVDYIAYEPMICPNIDIYIDEIQVSPGELKISLSIRNKSHKEINLSHTNFLLLDEFDKELDAKKENIANYDYEVVAKNLLHKVPQFIPAKSVIKLELLYLRKEKMLKLWINIPQECTNKCFIINGTLHSIELINQIGHKWTNDELTYFYNAEYAFSEYSEIHRYNNIPKINVEIIDDLIIPKTVEFFITHEKVFERDVFYKLANFEDYRDWNTAKRFAKDPESLKSIIKNNYERIDEECSKGHCGIISTRLIEPYMDLEIVEFVIKLNVKYAKRVQEWTVQYIDSNNFNELRPYLVQLGYIQCCSILKSKAENKKINQLICESNLDGLTKHSILKMKRYYENELLQSTIDLLFKHIPFNSTDELKEIKEFVSTDAWTEIKEKYFTNEQSKLD